MRTLAQTPSSVNGRRELTFVTHFTVISKMTDASSQVAPETYSSNITGAHLSISQQVNWHWNASQNLTWYTCSTLVPNDCNNSLLSNLHLKCFCDIYWPFSMYKWVSLTNEACCHSVRDLRSWMGNHTTQRANSQGTLSHHDDVTRARVRTLWYHFWYFVIRCRARCYMTEMFYIMINIK